MAYYKDLTPYEYWNNPGHILNVGWLEEGNPFSIGYFPGREQVLGKLKSMDRGHLCKGFHRCDFCNNESGNGEYRVKGKNGKEYSSPAMIIHYIEEHLYIPPLEWIEAVLVA